MSRDSEGVNDKIPNGKDPCPKPNVMKQRKKIGIKTSTELPPTSGDDNDVQCYDMSTEEVVTTMYDDDRWCQVKDRDNWTIVNDESDDEDDREDWILRSDVFNQEVDWANISGRREGKDRK